MEIGTEEYVKTKKGYIGKVTNQEKAYGGYYLDCMRVVAKENIVGHSKDIKKIIKEGDVIKYRVNNLSAAKIGEVKKHKDPRSNKEYLSIEFYSLEQIEILEILTKELFEKNKYKVEEG